MDKILTDDNVTFISMPVPVKKESKQIKDENSTMWREPRFAFSTLLKFYDWNSWHRRCILLKAGATCGIGWELVTAGEDKEPDDEYRRAEAFLQSCGHGVSFTNLAFRSAIDYYHLGNVFSEVVRNRKGGLTELYHAPTPSMRVGLKASTFWQMRYGKQVEWPRYEFEQREDQAIAHLADYDPSDDYYGMPEWLPAMATMALDRNAVSYNTYNFDNEFLAKVLLFIKGAKLDTKVKSQLQSFFKGEYKGVENAGKAVVIDVDDPNIDLKVEKLQMDTKDMSFLKSREFNRDEVVQMHNVPPRLLGIMEAGQLGGGGEIAGQLKVFRDITIAPKQRELEDFFNNIIVPGLDLKKWRLKFRQFDITTALEDAEFLSKAGQDLSEDERRERLGYKPRNDESKPKKPESVPALKNAGELVKSLVLLRKELEQYDEVD